MPKKPDPAPTVTEGRSRRTPKPNPKYANDFVQSARAVTPEKGVRSSDVPDDEYKPQAKKRLLDESLTPKAGSPGANTASAVKSKQPAKSEPEAKTPARKVAGGKVEKKATPASKLQTLRQQAQKSGLGMAKKIATPAKSPVTPVNKAGATKTPPAKTQNRNDNLDQFKIVNVSDIIGGDANKRKADSSEEEGARSKKKKTDDDVEVIDIEDEISRATPIKNQPKGAKGGAVTKPGAPAKGDNKSPAVTQRVTRQSPQVSTTTTGKAGSPSVGKASPAANTAAAKQSPLAAKTPVTKSGPVTKQTPPAQTKQVATATKPGGLTKPPLGRPSTATARAAAGGQQQQQSKNVQQSTSRTLKQLTADLQHTPSVSRSNSETDSDIELDGPPTPPLGKSVGQQQKQPQKGLGVQQNVKSPTGITTKVVSKISQQQQPIGKAGTQVVRSIVNPSADKTSSVLSQQTGARPSLAGLKSPGTPMINKQTISRPITSTPINAKNQAMKSPIAAKTPVAQLANKAVAKEANTPTAVSRIIGSKSPPNKPLAIQNIKTSATPGSTMKPAIIRPQAIQRPATSSAVTEPEKALEKTTNLEKWFVLNFPSISQQPPRAVLCLSLIKLGNNIKEMKLPSPNWSYRVTLQRINKENTDVKEVYTGDIEDSGIEEKDKCNYAPVNISFQCVANPEDPEARPIKSVTFQNKSFAIFLNDKQCRLIGSPQYIYDLVEIQTLLEVVDLVDAKHSYVDYDIK